MTTSRDPAYRELAARLVRLEKRFSGLSTPQIGHSSLENTSLNAYDETGQIVSTYGRLPDGGYGAVALSGPIPPTPTGPDVTVRRGIGLEITWHGNYTVQTVHFPLAGGRLEVYVSESLPITEATIPRTTIESPRGGTVNLSVSYDVPVYVAFALRSAAGALSDFSSVVGPYTVPRATAEDLDLNLDGITGTQIFYGIEDPILDANGGDVWYAEVGASDDGTPLYESRRLVDGIWKPLPDQEANAALAQAIGAATLSSQKAKWVTSDVAPTPLPDDPHYSEHHTLWWIDSANGHRISAWHGDAATPYWHEHRLGNGAIEPASLVASDVIATGTITSALLEAVLVLATTIIAGDPNATHVRMTPTGLRVLRDDPVDSVPDEVIRLGTETDDYFGIVDTSGALVGSWDSSGAVNARTGNFREDIVVAGQSVAHLLSDSSGGLVGRWAGPIFDIDHAGSVGIRGEYGIAQFSFPVVAGRMYLMSFQGPHRYSYAGAGEQSYVVRMQKGGGQVTLTSPILWDWGDSPPEGRWVRPPYMLDWTSDYTGTVSVGVSLRMFNTTGPDTVLKVPHGSLFSAMAFDMGPERGFTGGNQTNMGAGLFNGVPPPPAPPAVQTHFVELAPAGWRSYRGDGSLRNDVPGPVQGRDPSGYNGDGKGHWWFNVPAIHGTITNMEFYCYSNHWYLNSGGTPVFNLARAGEGGPSYSKQQPDWLTAGNWPKPGGRTVQLPRDWWEQYTTHPPAGRTRADGVTVGPGGDYGRFDGASARLRIWYTQ